jgi:hypothetical protein
MTSVIIAIVFAAGMFAAPRAGSACPVGQVCQGPQPPPAMLCGPVPAGTPYQPCR